MIPIKIMEPPSSISCLAAEAVGSLEHQATSLRPSAVGFRHIFTILTVMMVIASGSLFAQSLIRSGPDTLREVAADQVVLNGDRSTALELERKSPPKYTSEFYVQSDFWLRPHQMADAFFVFEFNGRDSLGLWFGGYSPDEKRIFFGSISLPDSLPPILKTTAEKRVEILNRNHQYVFRMIFYSENNQIRIDVNGVPLYARLPTTPANITGFGYMVRGGEVRFQKMIFKGK